MLEKTSKLIATSLTWGMLLILALSSVASAQEKLPSESDYYKIVPFEIPAGVVLEVGGLEMMNDGKLAVSSRRGDIYLVSNPFSKSPAKQSVFTLFAMGLHEVLGLAQADGWLYATQRCEVTRIKDEDGDGRGDLFETVSDGWEIGGDYHEYAFGSKFDRDGNMWVVLCLTGSFNSDVKFRGWCLRINKDGKVIPTCSGLRSPGGIGMNAIGDMFFTDNQGPWNGTCNLKFLRPGSFQGHPGGNKWYKFAENLGPAPQEPLSGSRIVVEAAKIPEYEPPAILFPYNKMGQSASGIACDTTGGNFGPFAGQMFVGDQTHSTVMRCYLERVGGHYQGACFPFLSGTGSGSLSLLMTKEGSLFVGGTNRGWGSRGRKPYSLDRIDFTGRVPFEVREMKARHDGFVLNFTEPIDPQTAGAIESYKMSTYCYIFQSSYGSPEVDHTTPKILKASVSSDRKSVYLIVDGLQQGHVHELHLDGIRSAKGLPLLHTQAYYTLNNIPETRVAFK